MSVGSLLHRDTGMTTRRLANRLTVVAVAALAVAACGSGTTTASAPSRRHSKHRLAGASRFATVPVESVLIECWSRPAAPSSSLPWSSRFEPLERVRRLHSRTMQTGAKPLRRRDVRNAWSLLSLYLAT